MNFIEATQLLKIGKATLIKRTWYEFGRDYIPRYLGLRTDEGFDRVVTASDVLATDWEKFE